MSKSGSKGGGHKFPKLPGRPTPPTRGGGVPSYTKSINPTGRKR